MELYRDEKQQLCYRVSVEGGDEVGPVHDTDPHWLLVYCLVELTNELKIQTNAIASEFRELHKAPDVENDESI
jgi:hypothetical protein